MYAVVDSSRTVRSCSADFARFCRAAEGALVGKALASFYEAASAADVAASFSEAEASGKCVERRVAVSGARDRAACWVLQSVAVLLPSRDAMVRWEVLPDGSAAVGAVSTRLLAEALEALPRRVALLDHSGQMLYRNAEFDRDAGLARQQPVSFMTDGLLHPDDKQRVLLDWNKSVTAHEETVYRSQYRMRHADKTFHLYDFAASPVKANGETLAWACSDVDIDSLVVGSKSVLESTQRILSALAVAEDYGAVRRAMLTELVRVSSSDLAYMCTVERGGVGAPMTFSRQRLVSFVYAPELPPNVFGSRCRPQEELPLDPLLAECVNTRSPRWLVLPDGQGPCFECKSNLPVSALLLPMFGSDDRLLYIACLKRRSPDYDETIVNVLQPLIRVCSCVCDAFERAEKVQEEVSRKREQMLLQAMLDVTQEAVVVVLDESFVIQNINGPAETLFGFANDDLRGRSVARILLSEELSDLKLAELFTLVLASGRPHELVGRHKNGSSIMLNMTALRVRFKGSSAFALFFRSVASLKEQDKKKVELLARLSHDFRGPLNGIFGMLTLLKGCELEDRASTYVNACIKSAEGLLAVLNDVLLFSSLDAGTHSVHRAPFNLFTLIEDVLVAASSAVSSSHDLDVTYSIDEAVPQGLLLGDANNLRQVLMNIIGNAVKFTKYGEISLDVHVHSHDPLELRFVCTDTGKGIEPGVLEQLFKAFSQGEASGMAGGLGLGLATCKKLVSLMGGQIGATSRMGRGSTFWFTVPLEIAPSSLGLSAFDDSVDAQQLALLKGVRVLVVDDNATNCVLLESILSRVGCLCISVRCGADAIEAVRTAHFRAEPFDVMLLDFHMPNMSGADVLRSVSALDVKKPKVVGLANVGHGGSSVFDRDLRSSGDEADQADVLAWVTKPFRRIELLRAVCNVLRTSESLLLAQTNPLSGSSEPADFPSVLVVEDDENSAQALVHLLERMRCHVTRAATGIEALERMNDTFRVVLIDAHLPLMDGISVTRWVRSRFPALPVHVLTADVSADLRRRCLEAGASFVHLKPITLSILTGIVRPLMTPSQWGSVLHGSSNLGELLSFSSPMKLERSGSNTSLLSPHRGGGDNNGATNLSSSPKKSELETRRSSGGSTMEGKVDAATATMKRKPSSQSDRAGTDSTNNSGVGSSTSNVATGRAGSNAFNSSSASRPIVDDLLVPPGGESDYVLVVDDNTANRDVLMGLLKLFRCNVLEASSGVEALDRMSKHVALVIMDIHMPVMDGFDATLAMKKRWPNVPVVMLTADATAQTRKRSFDVGASEVMVKPTKSHALHECLKQYAPHLLTQKPATSSSSPPKVEAAAVAVGTAAAVAPPTKEISFRILIVDDVSTNRTLAEYAVKKV
jgi:PAS domain S-box-containing protein